MNARVFLVIASLFFPGFAYGCGADTDCVVDDGFYRILVPQDGQANGALVFAHGYRGSATGTISNKSLRALAEKLGSAVVAIKSADEDWTLPGAPSESTRDNRDEVAYVGRVVEDAVARFGLDPDRFMAAGFSAGGMMTWNLICHDSTRFGAFVPLSGTFWRPEPDTCTTPPASVFHYHGTTDRIVPLSGRPIAQTHQGDVPSVLYMYETYGGYDTPVDTPKADGLTCDARENASGKRLEFCTFNGGHTFRASYIERAWHMTFGEAG